VIHAILTQENLIMVRQHLNDGFYLHSTMLKARHRSVAPVFTRKKF